MAKNLDFGLRRVVYDVEVAAKAIAMLEKGEKDRSLREVLKIAALIMARNLNAFLFFAPTTNPKHAATDIVRDEYGLSWTPDATAQLDTCIVDRIHKIAGHIVCVKPGSFKDNAFVVSLVKPLLRESVRFVEVCRDEHKAKYRGNKVAKYAGRANVHLATLGLPALPTETP